MLLSLVELYHFSVLGLNVNHCDPDSYQEKPSHQLGFSLILFVNFEYDTKDENHENYNTYFDFAHSTFQPLAMWRRAEYKQ